MVLNAGKDPGKLVLFNPKHSPKLLVRFPMMSLNLILPVLLSTDTVCSGSVEVSRTHRGFVYKLKQGKG